MNFNITLLLTRHFFLFILLSLFTYTLSAQSKWTDDLEIRANYHYGFVLPEYQNFIYLVDAPIQSFELGIVKQATGKNDWQQLYHYPAYGVSLFYSTLGNKEVNGQELALYPYFILHLISKKRFSLDNQIGIGIGYTNKKFDLNNNYQNVAVGSNFNIHFNLKLGAKYQLLKHISLGTGLSFDHFSNGNLGKSVV